MGCLSGACVNRRCILVSILMFVLLAGCSSKSHPPSQSAYATLEELRQADLAEAPEQVAKALPARVRASAEESVGLALAGGGTKASAFSMGVLKGLVEADYFFELDGVSSVSGGSYASYFIFSRLVNDQKKGRLKKTLTKSYFEDCFPVWYGEQTGSLFSDELTDYIKSIQCKSSQENRFLSPDTQFLHQQYIRCSQDIIESRCEFTPTREDQTEYFSIAGNLAVTAGSLPVAWTSNIIFDWPVNTSPSRSAYHHGIASAYGFYPTSIDALSESRAEACHKGAFEHCEATETTNGYPTIPKKDRITFPDLQTFYKEVDAEQFNVPLWTLNATATPSRSVYGWASKNETNFHKYSFRMTPDSQASNFHGEINFEANGRDLLDAVTASAAFFDANQKVTNQPWKFLGAASQQFLNLNWGLDLPVDKNKKVRHTIRNLLPFPLYYLDYAVAKKAAYVRLIDGGSTDNLGAYSLIESGVDQIIISDHALDAEGTMGDVCLLRNELELRLNRHLIIPALNKFRDACQWHLFRSENSELIRDGESYKKQVFYPITQWPYPFLVGCVTDSQTDKNCKGANVQKVWLIKPAYDLEHFIRTQLTAYQIAEYRGNKTRLLDKYKVSSCDGEFELSCELSAYFASYFNRKGKFPAFPQNSTVTMTIDSDPHLFGAYREMADGYTRQVVKSIKKGNGEFRRLLEVQDKYKIKFVSEDEIKAITDNQSTSSVEWTPAIRDAARVDFNGD